MVACGAATGELTIRSAVGRSIISVRSGDESTWQCAHAWLQYSPTLTCMAQERQPHQPAGHTAQHRAALCWRRGTA